MKKILYIILIALVFTSCREAGEYLPTEDFNYPIPQVNITENVFVGAFYHSYSTTDWDKKYTNTPELGEYSALDPLVMAQQKAWADEGGVDYFAFPWNGTSGDPLLDSFAVSGTENVKMVIHYNTSHLGATNSSPLVGVRLETMINELKTHATNHFGNDYYFKIDNRPVLIITPINLSSSTASSIDYTTVIPAIRAELNLAGVDVYIIGEITLGWLPPQRYAAATKAFDAVFLRDWKADGNYGYDRSVFFQSYSDLAFRNWSDSTSTWGMDFVPCIMPGFDDKVMSPASKVYDLARSAAFYTDMCNVAKRNMSDKRIVMINSWNNFQYGTTIEPATEYGTEYLEITRDQFKLN
mgnify:CR=1 FL=1